MMSNSSVNQPVVEWETQIPLHEWLLRERTGLDKAEKSIVYAVPAGTWSWERLAGAAKIQSAADKPAHPQIVPVSGIPLTESGQTDWTALDRLPVLDEDVATQWEEKLRDAAHGKTVAALLHEVERREPRVHLSELLPGWRPLADSPGAAAAPETAASEVRPTKPRPAAYSNGGPLRIPAGAPRTLTEALERTARDCPDRGVVFVRPDGGETFLSYAGLFEMARRILSGLQAQGLHPGSRVILQIESLPDHFASFWACVLGGITPVTVAVAPNYSEPGGVVNKLYNIWKLLEHPPILTNTHLAGPLAGMRKLFPGEPFAFVPVDDFKALPPDGKIHPSQPEDIVFLQLTSGSTGVPKCIQESHRGIIAHVHGSAQFNGYTPRDVNLNWLPVDHVVPILTCHLKDVYLGIQEVQASASLVLANPLRWLDLIEKHRATHTWAPNFGFKLVADQLAQAQGRRWDLSSMKFFMNAGEQVTLPVVKSFLEAVAPFGVKPGMMQPAFGMAEVCTCNTYANDFTVETGARRFLKSSLGDLLIPTDKTDASSIAFIDLGPPMPGQEIRITDANNQVVPEGRIGRFQIRGETVTPGYLKNPEANKEAFVGDGWFNSGDIGFIWDGRLTLTGREKEIIIVRGANFYCYEIEDVVNGLPGVEPTFVGSCEVSDPSTGTEGLAIFFVPQPMPPESLAQLIQSIRTTVAAQLGISPAFIVPLKKKEFPKTTSGKIQRSQMKKSLAAGHYDEILKEADLLLGNASTLPAWFFKKTWRPKARLALAPARGAGAVLMFADDGAVADALAAQFAGRGCVRVAAGDEFRRLAADRYCIDPLDAGHYRQLLASMARDKISAQYIVHLWTCRKNEGEAFATRTVKRSLDEGLYSVLNVVQALADSAERAPEIRLAVISCQSQAVTPGDTLADARNAVIGLLKSAPRELTWLRCVHVDVPVDFSSELAAHMAGDILEPHADEEVAYRGGRRWIPRLQRIDFSAEPKASPPFVKDGFYLVSGGLGGIGIQIARHLLEKHGAHVLLTGRTALPDRQEWDKHIAQGHARAGQMRALLDLESLPGKVHYEAVDICIPAALEAAVTAAGTRWQRQLDGVIHLAGAYREQTVASATRAHFDSVIQSKVFGTLSLQRLLAPGKLFISFSSVNGFFGGFSVAAYSAGAAFLDEWAEHQRQTGRLQSYGLVWSLWDEVGMSRGFQMKEMARNRGFHLIHAGQGMDSFLAAMHRPPGRWFIGLDSTNPNILRHVETPVAGGMELVAAVAEKDFASSASALQAVKVTDAFGTPVQGAFQPVGKIPLAADGSVDRRELRGRLQRREKKKIAPRTETEHRVARIWEEVLRVTPVGMTDDFFDLGGQSLLALRMLGLVEQAYGRQFPLSTLFASATVENLAKVIDETAPKPPSGAAPGADTSLVTIFCLPPAGGNALVYRHLAHQLKGEARIVALQPPGLDGGQEAFSRVEDLAAYYLTEIRRQQPQGPYSFAGVCFGAMVAYELARQMAASGQRVRMTALIDPLLPLSSVPNPSPALEAGGSWHRHRRNLAALPFDKKIAYVAVRLWNCLRRPAQRAGRWLWLAAYRCWRRVSGKTIGNLGKATVFCAEVEAWKKYSLPPCRERVAFLWSSREYSQYGQDHPAVWRRAAQGPVTDYALGCSHEKILEIEASSLRVAEALREELAATRR